MRSYKVTVAATVDLLTLSETKEHLKVDVDADDTLITNLIKAATSSCEEYTNRFFLKTTITQYSDVWAEISELLKSPVQAALFSISYYDINEASQTLSESDYSLDNISMPARVWAAPNKSFPNLSSRINAVEVTYNVGVDTAAEVDNAIKQAALLTIGHWYANRETVVVGRIASEVPMAAKYLLDQYKIQVLR